MKSCNHSWLRISMSRILNYRIKYTRQMPSLIQVFCFMVSSVICLATHLRTLFLYVLSPLVGNHPGTLVPTCPVLWFMETQDCHHSSINLQWRSWTLVKQWSLLYSPNTREDWIFKQKVQNFPLEHSAHLTLTYLNFALWEFKWLKFWYFCRNDW